MKVALITPVPDLELFATRSNVHLLLPELLDDPLYRDFYAQRRAVFNDYLILDNGAHEHDGPVSMSELIERGRLIGAQEIVLPDVQRHGKKTVAAVKEALDWISVHQEEYETDYHPHFMIVPQGRSMTEWKECKWKLKGMVRDTIRMEPVIGIAKHHEDLIDGGILRLVADCQSWHSTSPLHLLGWPRNLSSVNVVARMYPDVRSVDTARPFTFAKFGLDVNADLPNPGSMRFPRRDVEYFTEPVMVEQRGLAFRNIAWFQEQALGSQVYA